VCVTTGWTGVGLMIGGGMMVMGGGLGLSSWSQASLADPDAGYSLADAETARWVGVGGDTMFAFGAGMATGGVGGPALGALGSAGRYVGLGLLAAGTGTEAYNIVTTDWSQVDSFEMARYIGTRAAMLAGGFAGFRMAARAVGPGWGTRVGDLHGREGITFPQWRPGGSITQAVQDGSYPRWFSFSAAEKAGTIQGRYWINRALLASQEEFSARQLAIMQRGFAPQARVIVRDLESGTLECRAVSKELHHSLGNRGLPPYDEPVYLRELWPWEHTKLDPSRRLGYEFVTFAD